MATNRAIVWFVLCLLFFHHFQIDVCLGLDVPSAEDSRNVHQKNSFAEVHLNTSRDVIIRVGEQLKLNCTIIGTKNLSNYQLSWYHGTQRLAHMTTKLSNTTIQLVIDHVAWNSNGTYACKGTGVNSVQPKDILVRVGEIPSSPRDVWTNNVELRTQIHWTAPSQLGGLPLTYVVKAQCNSTSYPDVPKCGSPFSLCESLHILSVPNSDTLECLAVLRLFHHVIYNAYVEARNVLGSSRSDSVEFRGNGFNPFLTTPKPASGFSAREVTPAGTVKLSWKDAWEFRPFMVQYTILYHRDGDSYNKTLIVHSPRTSALIYNLSGFSLYYFYLLVQYGKTNITGYSDFSDAAVSTLQTKVAAPSHSPTINCSEWSSLGNFSGLTVTWKIPAAEYQNGPLKDVIIFYLCQRGLYEISGNLTVSNVTARSTTIPGLQSSDRCHVWMKTCNGPQFCSAISNKCTPQSLKDNYSPPSGRSKESILKTVAIVLGTLAGLALFLFILLYVRSRRRNNGDRQPLAAVLAEVFPSSQGYDEIDEQSVSHNYDSVDV